MFFEMTLIMFGKFDARYGGGLPCTFDSVLGVSVFQPFTSRLMALAEGEGLAMQLLLRLLKGAELLLLLVKLKLGMLVLAGLVVLLPFLPLLPLALELRRKRRLLNNGLISETTPENLD